ncbi:RNA methyltransferase [bacterium]|nr:RNA methyltransferase [bacterium]
MQRLTKKEKDRRQGLETNLHVRSFDSALSPEAFSKLPKLPLTVVLDNLRSAFNVGSIIRTADCVRAQKLVFCGYTAHPPHQKLEKTSLGALPYIPWKHEPDIVQAVTALKAAGIPVIALETTNRSRLLWEAAFPLPAALVLGNEALGISPAVLRLADDIVEIPMMGFKNSINVAAAFAIAAFEIQRQHWNDLQHDWHEHNKHGAHNETDLDSPPSGSVHNGIGRDGSE